MKIYRISKWTAIAMIAGALLIDFVIQPGFYALFGSGVVVNRVVSIFGGVIYGVWYWLKGIRLTEPKNLILMVVCLFLEIVPFSDILPAFSAGVATTIVRTGAVDTLNAKKVQLLAALKRKRMMQIQEAEEELEDIKAERATQQQGQRNA